MPDNRWSKSRPVFKEYSTEKNEREQQERKRKAFATSLKSELRKLAKDYDSCDVEDEIHIQTIRALADRLKETYADILHEDKLVFGVAQKALNVYLKYLWCANSNTRPLHCPFDNDIISALRPKSGCEHRWTYADKEDDYREWVRLARAATSAKGYSSLSEWEVDEWAAIQARKEQRRVLHRSG
jgi:hypothetical protein